VHQFSVDSNGDLYVAEDNGGRYQKYHQKPGGDRQKLIGTPAPLMPKTSRLPALSSFVSTLTLVEIGS
jgi:hypothetical protein